jgi:hypothetical protein
MQPLPIDRAQNFGKCYKKFIYIEVSAESVSGNVVLIVWLSEMLLRVSSRFVSKFWRKIVSKYKLFNMGYTTLKMVVTSSPKLLIAINQITLVTTCFLP